MGKKGKLPADKTTDCLYRAAMPGAGDVNEDDRSIPLILATETPVDVFDVARSAVVSETLRMDGMELPSQVPLVDSHERASVRNVLGSIRELKVEDGQLIGRAYFARDADAQRAFDNYRDGHLTDFSVGASISELTRDGDGNRSVVRSRLVEGSAVVAGHDPNAKAMPAAMRAYASPHAMKEEAMNEAMRAILVTRGMPEDATDEEAVAFLDSTLTTTETEDEAATTVVTTDNNSDTEVTAAEVTATETEDTNEDESVTAENNAAVAAERSRIQGIDDICRKVNASDEVRRGFVDGGTTVEAAGVELLRNMSSVGTGSTGSPEPRITSGTSDREKWYDAVRGGVITRTADSAGANPSGFLNRVADFESSGAGKYQDRDAVRRNEELQRELKTPAAGADDFRYATLPDIARGFLEKAGERVDGLPVNEICRRAMAMPAFVQRSSDGPAINTTGSFSNLLLDASNKSLLAGYDEADHTYSQWVRTAPSAADFKTLNRIRFGELADPDVIPENHEYPEKGTQDAKESYGVEKYGEIFSISLEAVVNDDLNAISRIPQMQGFAMRRKVNKVVYSVLTANDAMSDSIALFHGSSHGANFDATALSEAALDTGFNVMATQTGLSGTGTPLGIRPAYLIVPFALGATASRLVGGDVVSVSSGTTVPLYGAGRPRPLMVIEEPQLDANSTTGWYLAASSGAVETVEITFLQGEESPVLSREDGFSTDTIKYKIRQTFAAKAIDFRGLYQGNS